MVTVIWNRSGAESENKKYKLFCQNALKILPVVLKCARNYGLKYKRNAFTIYFIDVPMAEIY